MNGFQRARPPQVGRATMAGIAAHKGHATARVGISRQFHRSAMRIPGIFLHQ
jgi:hypothetical protein